MLDRMLDGPLVWTSSTLPDGAGRLALDAACRAELDAAVDAMRANPLPILALSPRDFALTACRRVMAGVREALDVRDTGRPPGNGVRPDVTN